MDKLNILHLCADIGSDSKPYQDSDKYNVIMIGKDIGLENFSTDRPIHGVIANPVCAEFSIAPTTRKTGNLEEGMILVNHCLRIIKEVQPVWWVLENPATGRLKQFLGKPKFTYQPWQYGSPWTKKTGLWGNFNIPTITYSKWQNVPKNNHLYVRPNRHKPSLVALHKSSLQFIPEFQCFTDSIKNDADLRSLCSQNFARAFFKVNH